MTYKDSEFSTVDSQPYSGVARGPGRWFVVLRQNGQQLGFAWTDDKNTFGLSATDFSADAQNDVINFLNNRNSWGRAGTSATNAFDAARELQEDTTDLPAEVIYGDLQFDLLEKVHEGIGMAAAPEYSMTVREDGEVLEAIRTDPLGQYLRVNGLWELIDPEADEEDYPTVYGQEWHEVTEDAIAIFDKRSGADDFTRDEVETYFI
jgi:hypothetical protein